MDYVCVYGDVGWCVFVRGVFVVWLFLECGYFIVVYGFVCVYCYLVVGDVG